MKDTRTIQGVLSIAALICIAAGWLNLFSPEINDLLYNTIFYVLIGGSFLLMAPMLANKNMMYAMYVAALFCITGAFFPQGSSYSSVKTIGLFAGVIISFFNRPRR
ncbi:MAG: hypothetical protein Q4G16_00530 [Cruoricaptor ignavus]|nr:hypothetical protein [Cruoricaptor ignavus]